MLIGVVSDTHGYLNPRVPELLAGVEHILHAGDIGDAGIIEDLARIAPVTTVRGNNDRSGPESLFPEEAIFELNGWKFLLTHEVKVPKGPDDPLMQPYQIAGADVVVFGHSHIAFQGQVGTVLFFNPGAAGKRRFKVVPSIGTLEVGPGRVLGNIIPI